jgi:hybrid cluster-associated redox disulfide protein
MEKMSKKNKITKDMKIEEVLNKYPETLSVFMKHGLHCIGCMAASFENIEDGASSHEIGVEKFVEELNKVIENDK